MGKKNSGGASSSLSNQVKGKNGPSSAQLNKHEVGGKASSKDQKKNEKKDNKNDHSDVTLISSPVLSVKVLVILLGRFVKASASFIISHLALIIGLLSLIAAF